ncbi:MAG: hypothetical protein HFF10_10225 [Angelakisella sp.]|jgi:glycerophosphoryl diester phosphodiesterase|nr:hypothetical protein [Angelakisella sp.]
MSYIIAHRGASYHAPENTLVSFRTAISMGAEGVETDIHLTRDGVFVLNHNYSIDGNSNGSGRLSNMTLAELRQYDFGGYKGEQYQGEPIATLDEFLETVKDVQVINLELKAPSDPSIPYVKPLLDRVAAHGLIHKTIFSAFRHSLLEEVKTLDPKAQVGLILTPPVRKGESRIADALAALPQNKPVGQLMREDVENISCGFSLTDSGLQARDAASGLLEFAQSLDALYPGMTAREIQKDRAKQYDLESYLSSLNFKPEFLHVEYNSILHDPELPRRWRSKGYELNPWTPDLPEEIVAMMDAGCWGIITNRCDLGVAESRKRSKS